MRLLLADIPSTSINLERQVTAQRTFGTNSWRTAQGRNLPDSSHWRLSFLLFVQVFCVLDGCCLM